MTIGNADALSDIERKMGNEWSSSSRFLLLEDALSAKYRGCGRFTMIEIDHPSLRLLFDCHKSLRKRSGPADISPALERIGLCLLADLFRNAGTCSQKPREIADWCTPTNVYPFAVTGGEDTHFSLLIQGEGVTESSPVVLTVPHSGGEAEESNFIVGDNLHEFLCLGYYRGFFSLEQMAFGFEETLLAHRSADWLPDDPNIYIAPIETEEQAVLDTLIEKFSLRPSTHTLESFMELQTCHKSKLIYPVEDKN